MTSEQPEIRLELTSNPLYLSGARELVSAVARRLGFSEEACGQVSLAVDEALCNVIRHGYAREPGRPIWVSLYPLHAETDAETDAPANARTNAPSALKIIIEDEARPVDPATIRSRDLDEIRPGGLGVHIIQAVMDEVRYERRQDKPGMRLIMTKSRANQCESADAGNTDARGCCGGLSEMCADTRRDGKPTSTQQSTKNSSGKPAAAASAAKDVEHG